MKILLLLLSSLIATAATTTVTGNLKNANGSGYNGYLYISWPTFSSVTGDTIPAGERFPVKVTSGVFSVTLEPSVNRAFVYTVQYQLQYGKVNTEWWVIPTSGPVDVAIVRTNVYLFPGTSVALSELGQGGATNGQSLVWSIAQASYIPTVQGVPCTITATTSITCTHNLNSTYVIVEVKDASGNTEVPATVRVTGVNTVIITFDTAFTGVAIIK